MGRGLESHHPPLINFYDFSRVELEKHSLRYTQETKTLGY